MQIKITTFVLASIILVSAMVGCGYHVMGRGGAFPEGITSVAIVPLENDTREPNLTAIFTSALRREFIFRRDVEVVTEQKAEATLEGAITALETGSVAYNTEGRATEYDISVTLDARLIRRGTKAVLWKGDKIKGTWHYMSSLDVMTNESNKNQAIQKIATDLSEKIYIMIKERF
jgi:outer membrane lipopolysaccharide assembly protein LptE/RlpB